MFTKLVTIKFLNEPDSVLYDITDGFVSDRCDYDFNYVVQGKRSVIEIKSIKDNVPCLWFSISDEQSLNEYIDGFKKLVDRHKKLIEIEVRHDLHGASGGLITNDTVWHLTETAIIHTRKSISFSKYGELVSWVEELIKNSS